MAKNLHVNFLTFMLAIIPLFQTQAINESDKLWDSDELFVSNIYPNPAVDVITLDYRLLKADTKASIIIRNVIGSEMGVLQLNGVDTQATLRLENFSSGIYFYTLRIDGQETVTKKFMVNR